MVAGCVSSRGLRTIGTPLDPHSLEAERSLAPADALKSWDDAMTAYKGGLSGPLTPLIARQQLLLLEGCTQMDLRLLKAARRFGLVEWLIAAISVLTRRAARTTACGADACRAKSGPVLTLQSTDQIACSELTSMERRNLARGCRALDDPSNSGAACTPGSSGIAFGFRLYVEYRAEFNALIDFSTYR